jgi:hypothetical protein
LRFQFLAFRLNLEVLKVISVIHNQKDVFSRTPGFVFFVFQQPGPMPDHLTELGIEIHLFSKGKIDDVADVDTVIQHINDERHTRHIVIGELIEQTAFAVKRADSLTPQYFIPFTIILRI